MGGILSMLPYRKCGESFSLYQTVRSGNDRPYWPYLSPTHENVVSISEVLILLELSFFPTSCPMQVFALINRIPQSQLGFSAKDPRTLFLGLP